MKPIAYCIILFCSIATAGCVSRTVTESKGFGSSDGSDGANPTSKVIEKKIVWFWQDEFRHPQQ